MNKIFRASALTMMLLISSGAYADDLTLPGGMSGSNPRPRQMDQPAEGLSLADVISLLSSFVGW